MDSVNHLNDNDSNTTEAREKLLADLKIVIKDAESLMKQTGAQTGENLRHAKAAFGAKLQSAKSELARINENVVVRSREAAKATDDYVQNHPWQSVGLGVAIGVVVGMLISRR